MKYSSLIIGPGHGICINPSLPNSHDSWVGIYDYWEEAWLLTQHCRVAFIMAAMCKHVLLVYSGGVTRENSCLAESESYVNIIQEANYWGADLEVKNRILIDKNSRDSLGNLFFSIATFRLATGFFPKHIYVAGFEFKKERYHLHIEALKWARGFSYICLDNPPEREGILDRALKGEANKVKALIEDPLLLGDKWKQQRRERNPRGHPLPDYSAVPGLQAYMDYLYSDGDEVSPPWA